MTISKEECSSAKSSPSLSDYSSAHYLAKCVLRGSAVLQVLYGHIRSSSSRDVIFGKETSIELVVIGEDGIVKSVCDQAVFGTIKDLALLPWHAKFHARDPQICGKDLLVVISDSGKLSLLAFCNEMHRFFPVTHVQLSNPGNTRHLPGRILAVDFRGCFIAASAYEDQLALFSVSNSKGSDIIDKRMIYPPESEGTANTSRCIQGNSICGTIWSMSFISQDSRKPSKEHSPVLAILLTRKDAVLNELLLLEWNIEGHAIDVISQYVEAGPLAHHIVEVPNSYGLAFLFRAGDALLMDLRDTHNPCCVYRTSLNFLSSAAEEQTFFEDSYTLQDFDDERFNFAASAFLKLSDYDHMSTDSENESTNSGYKYVCSWSWRPENNRDPKMIFCVDTGEFFMIEIVFNSNGLKVNLSKCLYKGLPCKALLWVEGEYLAVLVDMGDGMVLKLEDGRLCYKSSIQNIAPILDMAVVDCHDEKHDQIFACCGVAPEGSLRIIQSGISVEKLVSTAPIYQGITGIWTMKMKFSDLYHSFLVLSFVEQTRILTAGTYFIDMTDFVGFQPGVCTLACGLVSDGWLAQIHRSAVRVCLPSRAAHSEGVPVFSPICTSWSPKNVNISLGAVGHNFIVVSTSNPCLLFILGVRHLSDYHCEIFDMQQLELRNELSCISIPRQNFVKKQSNLSISENNCYISVFPSRVDTNKIFVIGTHRPSVEIFSLSPDRGVRSLACGTISIATSVSGCVPQDVQLVFNNRLYVLAGLRNGMLLRFEWPSCSMMSSSDLPSQCPVTSSSVNVDTSLSNINLVSSSDMKMSEDNVHDNIEDLPTTLQLVAVRRIGITPVFLVPLGDKFDADIIALCDRPWLLHTARHSLSYTSISFQPSTHVTPVFSAEYPGGMIFVAENSIHLVEMAHCKKLSVQKFHLEGTPRKVLYHNESRMLLVMRTDLNDGTCSSDICCVNPLSGSVLSSFRFEPEETGKCMELVRVGSKQVLLVGTSLLSGPAIMPSGEAERNFGRLIVLCLEHVQNSDSGFRSKAGSSSKRTSPFHDIVRYPLEHLSSSSLGSSPVSSYDGIELNENEIWQLRFAYSTRWQGMVLAICPYLDRFFLASAGNAFHVCGFHYNNPERVRRLATGETSFVITSLTAHFTRIAVGDCRDGVLFFAYNERKRRLEQLHCDPLKRLVADCILMDVDRAIVSDRAGSIAVLCSDHLEVDASSECNLTLSCAYYMAEVALRIRKGAYSYRLPANDVFQGYDGPKKLADSLHNTVIASTLLGSIMTFIRLSREEYELLEALQARLAIHPLTAPVLGNDHNEFRGRKNPVGTLKILDGDMLIQFLELTIMQQEAILSDPLDVIKPRLKPLSHSRIPVNQGKAAVDFGNEISSLGYELVTSNFGFVALGNSCSHLS